MNSIQVHTQVTWATFSFSFSIRMPERVLGSMVTYQDMPDESVIGTAGFWASPTDLARLSQFACCCPRRIMQSEKFENREKFTFKNNNFFNSCSATVIVSIWHRLQQRWDCRRRAARDVGYNNSAARRASTKFRWCWDKKSWFPSRFIVVARVDVGQGDSAQWRKLWNSVEHFDLYLGART